MSHREELELLGRVLADFRLRAHLTQAHVGTAIGVHRLTVGQWERGLRPPTISDLCRLAQLFDVPVSEVVRKALDRWIPPTLKLVRVRGVANYESSTRRKRKKNAAA